MSELLPEVKEFLASQPLKMYVGGDWVESSIGATFETRDPGKGIVLAKVFEGRAEDVDRAVQAARKAFRESGWVTMAVEKRNAVLHKLADLIDERIDIISKIESLDVVCAIFV